MNTIQKLIALILILIIPVFLLSNYTILKSKKNVSSTFASDFIHQAPIEIVKSFVFILPVTDEHAISNRTLSSIFSQTYENYRIILIDGTFDKENLNSVYKLAHQHNKDYLLSVLRDEPNSFYHAIHSCRDDEIIVQMNTDDWLAHESVLERINQVYSNENVWLAYSQYLEYPSLKKGRARSSIKRALKKPTASQMPWVSSSFKTYYAGLFKQIKAEDALLDAFMVPLVEMSEMHIRFIDDVLYVHSS